MHFPNYPISRSLILKRFYPEDSDGACYSTDGKSKTIFGVDQKGNTIRTPVRFQSHNPRHIRFATFAKCQAWLKKIKSHAHIVAEDLFIH